MKTIRIQSLLLIALVMGSCGLSSQSNSQTLHSEKVELTNKQKVVALLNSFNTGDQTPIAYINSEKYIQHNLAVGDGLAGFGAVMQHAPEGGFKAEVVRAFQDGDFVFTHTVYDFFGPKIGFDIFRFEDGLIVEHWDNLIPVAAANPSGRTQTDGSTEITDKAKTAANKQLVKDFIHIVLVQGQYDKMGNFFNGDAYIQHNPFIADGLSGLGAAMGEMAKNNVQMIFTTNHKIMGEGNFVLSVSEGTYAGQPTSFYDLFRIENGKIAEHWDVMETILPETEWKNQNGKF